VLAAVAAQPEMRKLMGNSAGTRGEPWLSTAINCRGANLELEQAAMAQIPQWHGALRVGAAGDHEKYLKWDD